MSIFSLKKVSVLLIFITFISIYFLKFDNFFTLQFLKDNNELLIDYVNKRFFYSICIFYSLFYLLLFLFLPITSIMVVFSSYLFGTLITIFLSITVVTFGGLTNVFILKKITFTKIHTVAKSFLEKIKAKIKGNELQYLISLRFIPIPFIIQNAILTILNISKTKFIVSTVLGIVPWMVIYSLAGFKLKEIIYINNEIKMEDIINNENFSILGLFILIVLFSIFIKKKII